MTDILTNLHAAIKKHSAQIDRLLDGADLRYVMAEARSALDRYAAFDATDKYLSQLEERKVCHEHVSDLEEKEALRRARSASEDVRIFFSKAFRIIQHLKATGIYDQMMDLMIESLEGSGQVSFHEYWAEFLGNSPEIVRLAKQQDLDFKFLDRFPFLCDRCQAIFQAKDGVLHVRPEGKRGKWLPVFTKKNKNVSPVKKMLAPDILDVLIQAVERPGILSLEIFEPDEFAAPDDLVIELDNVLAVNATLIIQEIDRYVNLLEYGGLPAYRGRDPFWWLLGLIAIGCFIAGVVIKIVCVKSDKVWQKDHEKLCDVIAWDLMILGLIGMLLGGGCSKNEEMCNDLIKKTIAIVNRNEMQIFEHNSNFDWRS